MKRYFTPINTLKDEIAEMIKQNKRLSLFSKEIYSDMGLPKDVKIKSNMTTLEIEGIEVLDKTIQKQFRVPNKTMNYGIAKNDSEINKKWQEVVKKYNLEYYSTQDMLMKILNVNLILENCEIFVLPNLEIVIISSETRQISDFSNMVELKESEMFEKRMVNARIHESKIICS